MPPRAAVTIDAAAIYAAAIRLLPLLIFHAAVAYLSRAALIRRHIRHCCLRTDGTIRRRHIRF